MKGTMSEMELSIVRQRSLEALEQKARRGELFLNVAIGYLKVSNDRIDKDPDRRIQEALALVFTKFAEMQTPRQVHLCLRQERITLPGGRPWPRGPPRRMEVTSVQYDLPHPDQSRLCWRLCLRALGQSGDDRGRPQEDRAGLPARAQRLGGFDQGPP
ncbi:blr0012 [Bradyrhizobium diazoefficiens USDA 110]|uniref:Blr0012 protein n=2 Tax=Nitrobacteraceae TaxID=41294 RepID=Q89YE0_BRADU|nr:blr0012 [Bradyrhizobium diazoefficiens USDA 110]